MSQVIQGSPGIDIGNVRAYRRLDQFVWDVVAFLIPALLFLEIGGIGRLYFSELILLALFPVFILKFRRLLAPFPKTVLVLGAIWLLGQMLTDIVRVTPFEDWSRGWAKIIFTLINFIVLYLLMEGNRRRILLFAAGLAIGVALTVVRGSMDDVEFDRWKFGFGLSATVGAILISMLPGVRKFPFIMPIALAAMGAISLVQGSRSLAGICLVASGYLVVSDFFAARAERGRPVSSREQVLAAAILFAIGAGVLQLYEYLASTGTLGETQQARYERQMVRGGNVITGGRSEIQVSLKAIKDSPVIGHGSWAKDIEYIYLVEEMERSRGITQQDVKRRELGLIPTHSHFFGAWVEAGIVGALFWGIVVVNAILMLTRLFRTREPLMGLIVFMTLTLAWDIVFSPFGASRRIFIPYLFVLVALGWSTIRANRSEAAVSPA